MWVKIKVKEDDDIFNDVLKRITKNDVLRGMNRNGETAYGYLGDYLLDYYDVTLEQNDRVAKRLMQHFGF